MRISVPVGDWTFIDATIDNTVSSAAHNGDEFASELGLAIGEAGWTAARLHPRTGQGQDGWPEDNDELTLDLPPTSWFFLADQLRYWDSVDSRLNPRDGRDPASRFLVPAQMVEDRLT